MVTYMTSGEQIDITVEEGLAWYQPAGHAYLPTHGQTDSP